LTIRGLENAYKAGKVTKEYVDRYVIDNRVNDKRGFGVTSNMWILAMSGAYYGALDSGDTKLSDIAIDMDDFTEKIDLSGHLDIAKIVRLDIADDDKVRRLIWWVSIGRYMEKSNVLLELISGLGRQGPKAFMGIGALIGRSRFLVDVEMSDSDRVDLLSLSRLYKCNGNLELFDEECIEDYDAKTIVHRHASIYSGKYLGENQTKLAANLSGMELFPKKMTVEEVAGSLTSWRCKDVIAMFEVIRKKGDNIGFSDGGTLNDMGYMMMGDELNTLDSVDWSSTFSSMMASDIDKFISIGSVVLEKGMSYIISKGRRKVRHARNTDLDLIVSGLGYNGYWHTYS